MEGSRLEDYKEIAYMGLPDISVSAGLVAYTRTTATDWEYLQEIRVLPVGERLPDGLAEAQGFRLSAGGKKEFCPRFSPDGAKLAFLSDQDGCGTVQIWLSDLAGKGEPLAGEGDMPGGGARRLTAMRRGVKEFCFSPDGSRIAFLAECAMPEDEAVGCGAAGWQQPEEERPLRLEEAEQPVITEDYGYKSDEAGGFVTKSVTHLFVVEVETGQVVRLADGKRDDVMPFFSPDGEWVFFASGRMRPAEESIGMDLFRVPARGGEVEQVTDSVWIAWYPAAFQPLYASDGSFVVIGALEPALKGGMPATRLYKVTFEGGQQAEGGEGIPAAGGLCQMAGLSSLWPEDAPCHEATCFLYNGENYGGFSGNAFLSEDNRFVYFISGWHGTANVYRAATGGTPCITQVTHFDGTVRFCKSAGHGKMLLAKGDFTSFAELYLYEEESGVCQRLTDTTPWLAEKALSKPQELWFHTLDGAGEVQGWVIPPQEGGAAGETVRPQDNGTAQEARCPAVLYIHGGPTPFYGNALAYEHQLLAGAGFAVLICNPRGSSGYGAEHGLTGHAYDGTAMTDLLQFVEEACRRFAFIDPARIGVTGGSYGGYMTNWLAGHTKRFRAAVSQRGVANELIQYASSDMAGSSEGYGSFADFMKEKLRNSPVAYADRIDIPFLLLHGMDDMRCPVEHAHQMYTALKDTHPDLPVRMVLFPGCGHELPMGGPMAMRTAHYREMLAWFEKYL